MHRRHRMCRNSLTPRATVYYDQTGNTLTVWFGNPQDEYVCEGTGDEVVLMKDKAGRVIGFEKLNFSLPQVVFETVTT